MSVHRYETADGTRWRVRWRDPAGQMHSRTFPGKREATAFDADVKAKKYKGEALPRPAKETLATAYDEWFRLRGSKLAETTQATYGSVWNAHVRGRFDHHRIAELANEPQLFEELLADMTERGVGNASQRKVLVVMSAVLTAAYDWKKISTNPLWRMRKPSAKRKKFPRPFPPIVVEILHLTIYGRESKDKTNVRQWGDSAFVTLMAYAGLRPGEALALVWDDIGRHTITVEKSNRNGKVVDTKTEEGRVVPLTPTLASDLADLRNIRGNPDGNALVLPAHDGGLWSRSEFNNWRNRVWQPAVTELAQGRASLAGARPYDCRGSFVSMHLRAGANPIEVAQWAGHSPAVMFKHYANVIEELRGEPILPVAEQISRARQLLLDTPEDEMNDVLTDITEHPTVSSGGKVAAQLYTPDASELPALPLAAQK